MVIPGREGSPTDGSRPVEALETVVHHDGNPFAGLEQKIRIRGETFRLELSAGAAGADPASPHRKPPRPAAGLEPGPKPAPQRPLVHIAAAEETKRRVEVLSDVDAVQGQGVAVVLQIQLGASGLVSGARSARPRIPESRPPHPEGRAAPEPGVEVGSGHAVRTSARAVEARGNHPGRGALAEVRLQAKDRVPGRRNAAAARGGVGVQRPPGPQCERSDGDRTRLPGEPGAPLDVAFEAHPATEEDCGLPPAPELEQPGALEEELPLFREEEVEPGEVDLDVVRLDLGEVGVPGQIERQVGGQPVFQVQTGLRLAFDVGLAGELPGRRGWRRASPRGGGRGGRPSAR